MTQQETAQLFAIIKAAYPNNYRGMTKEEAVGTINIWHAQFAREQANLVLLAVERLIGTSAFPPSIAEVKEKIKDLYYDALEELPYQHGGIFVNNVAEIPADRVAFLNGIIENAKPKGERSLATADLWIARIGDKGG